MCKGKEKYTEEYLQEKSVERIRRLAFWGTQIQYTLTALVVLFLSVMAVLIGLYLYICKVKLEPEGTVLPFAVMLQSLPVYPAFLVLVLGSQVILARGFVKQEKSPLTMQRILLSPGIRFGIRFRYSLLVSVAAFVFYFSIICLLLFFDAVLFPESFYGAAEWYPTFMRFRYLYAVYPVVNPWALVALPVCIVAVAQISTLVTVVIRPDTEAGCTALLMALVVVFCVYSCASTIVVTIISFVVMAVMCVFAIGIGFENHKKGLAYEEA